MLDIINRSKLPQPDYVDGALRELAHKARIAPISVTLILKGRNKMRGISKLSIKYQRLVKKHQAVPSGSYEMDRRTVVVHMGRGTSERDFRFVLAHELGHLKQHLEKLRPLDCKTRYPTEAYANRFAILTCHCYPKANYKLAKYLKREWNKQ